MLPGLSRAYDRLIAALAVAAGVAIAVVCIAIAIDVVMASSGLRPPVWVGAVTEYILLYLTLLAAPWLVRQKGHVTISGLRNLMAPTARRILEKAAYLLAIAVSLLLAWLGAVLTWESLVIGDLDIRSFEFPRWLVYLPMPIGLTLVAVEFARLLVRGESLHDEPPAEGL